MPPEPLAWDNSVPLVPGVTEYLNSVPGAVSLAHEFFTLAPESCERSMWTLGDVRVFSPVHALIRVM